MSRASLAREKGVSRAAVSLACADGGPLADSIVGNKINADDPPVIAWLSEPVRGPESDRTHQAPDPSAAAAPTKAEMLALTRRKREAEARRLELANAITEQRLISRELVETHLLGLLDGVFSRLLRDTAQTIAVHAHSLLEQHTTVVALKSMVRDQLSRTLSGARERAVRALRSRAAVHPMEPPADEKRRRVRRKGVAGAAVRGLSRGSSKRQRNTST